MWQENVDHWGTPKHLQFKVGQKVIHKDPKIALILGPGTIIRHAQEYDWIVDCTKRGEIPFNEKELERVEE